MFLQTHTRIIAGIILLAASWLGGASLAHAEDLPQPDRATLVLIKEQAQRGYMGAQFALALEYRIGNGVPKDAVEAAEWMGKAAQQGYAPAQYDLAMMYANGEGVPEDKAASYKWLLAAAKQNNPDADFLLGSLSAQSAHTHDEQASAYKLLCLAAAQGDYRAETVAASFAKGIDKDVVDDGMHAARDWLTQHDTSGEKSLQFGKWYLAHTEITASSQPTYP